jgi:hypothetical protein
MSRSLTLALAIGFVTLAWRAVFDKIVAMRGGAELVATWAQLQSIADLVAGVVGAGIAPGVAVLVAQAATSSERRAILRGGLRLGAIVAGIALAIVGLLLALPLPFFAFNASGALVLAAASMGFVVVAPSVVGAYWTGCERRYALLAWASGAGAITAALAWAAPRDALLAGLIVAGSVPALAIAAGLYWRLRNSHERISPDQSRALARYIAPSLAIGVFSPIALIVTRAVTAQTMSIADVGVMQAIWRSSEWMTHLAGTVMAIYFSPKLAAATNPTEFARLLRRGLAVVMVPTAIGFVLMAWMQRGVLASLYDASFIATDRAVVAFYFGEWLRVGAWLYLYALYSRHATGAATIGEFLSLPLFAALVVVFRDGLDLERAGLLYCASFAVYLAFNHVTIRRFSDSKSVREMIGSARSSAR